MVAEIAYLKKENTCLRDDLDPETGGIGRDKWVDRIMELEAALKARDIPLPEQEG